MEDQPTAFEQCHTQHQIEAEIQDLTGRFLTSAWSERKSSHFDLTDYKIFNPAILIELSDVDLLRHENPLYNLCEVCRLLIKRGNMNSLNLSLSLSHRIYGMERSLGRSGHAYFLYKGISQIGLGLYDVGTKNVVAGMTERNGHSLAPIDSALAHWALLSASIFNRNISLALNFSEKWQKAAKDGGLRGEIFRSRFVRNILYLILGDRKKYLSNREELFGDLPDEWRDVEGFLEKWSLLVRGERVSLDIAFVEPCPLILGIDWHKSAKLSDDEYISAEFAELCRLRQKYYSRDAIEEALLEDKKSVLSYANTIARWDLPIPLREVEAATKEVFTDSYYQSVIIRLLGKNVWNEITSLKTMGSNAEICNDSIILVMDVRNYSSLCENESPEKIYEILNPIFRIMNEELESIGGSILEFVGDCIIVAFNMLGDQKTSIEDILFHTSNCLRKIHILNALRSQTNMPEINIGVGINGGPVAMGYLGGMDRCHLTVLGNTINVASRIESATKSLPGNALVSKACFYGTSLGPWKEPWRTNFTFRDLGRHKMRNIDEPIQLFSTGPLLRYWVDFVPLGFVARPEKGIVYVDTGNSAEPGIIDHHYEGNDAQSACELLMTRPELLLDHVNGLPASEIEFRLHTAPDLDCLTTLYAAYELMDKDPRLDILTGLADYVSRIDQGIIPYPEKLEDSLYGIFIAHQKITEKRYASKLTDFILLESGMRVIDAAVYLMEKHVEKADLSSIFQFETEWFAEERTLIKEDRARYKRDLDTGHTYNAYVNGLTEPVTGLWLNHPESIFFKLWARNDQDAPGGRGYPFMAVDISEPERNRFVFSVDPESGIDLKGLGEVLEKHETKKRKALGKERPVHPIRYPSDNSDPWYFGQGHGYTIIDSPATGTILTAEEVKKIHEDWEGCKR